MVKRVNYFTKILLLIAMIFSDLMTPIKVLAEEIISVEPTKGDVGINNTVSSNGGNSVTVSAGAVRNEDGSLTNEGDISVTKTVSKVVDEITGEVVEGRYRVEFNVKGKDITDTNTTTKPVYVVVVFDRSGSMEDYDRVCTRYITYHGEEYCADWDDVEVKFSSAVSGAKTFAETLLEKIPTANIALVTFSSSTNGTPARGFASTNLDNANFGSPDGGTNLHAGLKKANELLSDEDVVPSDANKYVVVISDGQPTYYVNENGQNDSDGSGSKTSRNELVATLAEADAIKSKTVDGEEVENAEIFAIGYSLPTGNVYDDTYNSDVSEDEKYGALTAEDILTRVATTDTAEDIQKNISHYMNADPAAIVTAFTNIATEIGRISAGTNATISDNVGSKFKIVNQDGSTYTSDVIEKITDSGTTISFEIDVDDSSVTKAGWYNTNEGFSLTYTNSKGEQKTITCEDNPQVWLTPEIYEYTVNYYKDSFDTMAIASDVREATNGTIINESNVLKDKYLNNSELGTEGYEFNSLNPSSIIIDDNNKVINVLYTIKKFSYIVNYYYDGILDSTITENDVNYGTVVDSESYYLDSSDIKEGYGLDTVNSDSASFTITDNIVVIDIYYKKNSYSYVVNYYFNNNIDNDFTKNSNALFGTVINANENYLDDGALLGKETEDETDYFINPILPSNPSQIIVGTNVNENIINIYYISTVVTNEDMDKTTNTDKITSGDTPITYTVNYTSVVKNVNKGDTVKVVITDTLPLEIEESMSTLNGGVYDASSKTITWTFETTMDEFTEVFDASKTISYTVVYKNVGNGDGSTLTNSVVGNTTAGGKTTVGKGDSTDVKVEIPGKVTAIYVDEDENTLADSVTTNGLVGESYTTSAKNIFGYTLTEVPSNKDGIYTEEDVTVKYIYDKNDGVVEDTEVVKSATDGIVDSVDGIFGYTITATGEVRDYVGDVTVKVTDNLPYELTEDAINNLSDECTYDGENKTITCVRVITIDENDYTNGVYNVNEVFNLELEFVGIDSEVVTNSAKVEISLDSNIKDEDDDTEDVTVLKGKVVATYTDIDGNKLHDDVTTEDLVGKDYTTEEKEFFGYTLTEVPSNKDGVYTKEDIIVEYVYDKNDGVVEDTEVVKSATDGTVDGVDGIFGYTITATGEVRDYVGDVTVKVTDNLPYELTEDAINKLSDECTYDSENKTITCVRVITIDENDYTDGVYNVNEVFNLELEFVGIDSEIVTNSAKVEISLDSNIKGEDDDEEETRVLKGTVVATYKDTLGNTLHEDVTSSDLAGKEYTTEIKEFYGYTLVNVPSNKDGKYLANTTIYVDYVYKKNPINVTDNKVEKIGPDSVNRIDETFNYVIKYTATIKEHTGKVTLRLTDTLPFEAVIISYDNSCNYYDGSIVCEKEYYVDSDTTINEEFNISLKYVDIKFDEISTNTILTNNVKAEFIYDDETITNSDSKDTEVYKGTVIATYKDTDGNILHEDVISSDLAGKEYTTEEKEFFGYTLTEVPSNKNGTYLANSTIYVEYVYDKNDGTLDNTEVVKSATDGTVDSVDGIFRYTITATGEVRDYVGDVTVKVTDNLPYELTEDAINKLSDKCTYDSENKTITCVRVITIDENDYTDGVYNVNEVFNLELEFVGIDSEIVTNSAKVEISLDSNVKDEDIDEEETRVLKGTVVATYKDTLGNTLHEDVTSSDLAGKEYITEIKEFYGYTLVKVPSNKNGTYLANSTIYVEYVYDKNDGVVEDTEVVKSATDGTVDGVDETFGYTITATGEVRDYVGDVTVKVTDNLPYELTEDAINKLSDKCTYDSENKTITCVRVITIDENDYTDGVYNVNEVFNLELEFVGIDSEIVTNSAKVEISLDSNVKDEDIDEEETRVLKGTVVATYKDTLGNTLHEDVTSSDLAGKEYITEIKEFYGYTLVKVPSNKDGKYLANTTVYVDYVYSKNIGTSTEELVKNGLEIVEGINSEFKYVITYNTIIKDYIGMATLVITDELPYEIDIEKSVFGDSCEYTDGKLVCTYKKDITKENNVFDISEIFSLYYLNIDSNIITNKANSVLTYGNVTKENDSEYTSEVKMGNVIVNYVTTDGTKLADSIMLTGMIGEEYATNKKVFDKYNFIEVVGNTKGKYIDGTIEVTYVYDITPLPPQTGVDMNLYIYIKYLVLAAILVVSDKTYKLLKNN